MQNTAPQSRADLQTGAFKNLFGHNSFKAMKVRQYWLRLISLLAVFGLGFRFSRHTYIAGIVIAFVGIRWNYGILCVFQIQIIGIILQMKVIRKTQQKNCFLETRNNMQHSYNYFHFIKIIKYIILAYFQHKIGIYVIF